MKSPICPGVFLFSTTRTASESLLLDLMRHRDRLHSSRMIHILSLSASCAGTRRAPGLNMKTSYAIFHPLLRTTSRGSSISKTWISSFHIHLYTQQELHTSRKISRNTSSYATSTTILHNEQWHAKLSHRLACQRQQRRIGPPLPDTMNATRHIFPT